MNTKTTSPAAPANGRRSTPPKRRPALLLAGTVVVIGALFAMYVASNKPHTAGPKGSSFHFAVGKPGPGAKAPPVVLASTAGGTFDLHALAGKTVLLYFQEGVGCQPCWNQMRDIEQNWKQFTAVGVDTFVTITSDSLDLVSQKLKQDGIAGPVLADTDLAVSKTYDANHYGMMGDSTDGHSFVLVGPDGTIKWRADYGGSPDYTMYVPVAALLADLAAGTKS